MNQRSPGPNSTLYDNLHPQARFFRHASQRGDFTGRTNVALVRPRVNWTEALGEVLGIVGKVLRRSGESYSDVIIRVARGVTGGFRAAPLFIAMRLSFLDVK